MVVLRGGRGMTVPTPHFLLFSEAANAGPGRGRAARWHFCLESPDGERLVEAMDEEATHDGERLELLAVVRGLEALDEPARITLITPSRYVHRGLRYGLKEWRDNQWCWERFGSMVSVRDRDLWERLDRALQIHDVRCRVWNAFPVVHALDAAPAMAGSLAHEPVAPVGRESEAATAAVSSIRAQGARRTRALMAARQQAQRGRLWGTVVRTMVARLLGRRTLANGMAG